MNKRDLEYFVAIAEELHFGRAAQRCHVSQPALSGQIKKLEDSLEVTLFERTKRRVRLTETGSNILAYAREALRQMDLMKQTALAEKNPLSGACTIGAPHTIGPYISSLLLRSVHHSLPDLNVELVEDFTDNLERQLLSGDLDFALLATTPVDPKLAEIKLYEEPFWVAVPGNHELAKREMVDISQIDTNELLLLSDGHCLRDQVYAACNLRKGTSADTARPKTQRTSLTTILSLVSSGAGVTLVPAMSLSSGWTADTGIAIRPEQTGAAGRTIRLTYRKGYHRDALLQKLADIIAANVPNTVDPVRR